MHFRPMIICSILGFVAFGLIHWVIGLEPRRPARKQALRRALNEDPGRMNVTGKGRGTLVEAEDPDGARSRHIVGRGVI